MEENYFLDENDVKIIIKALENNISALPLKGSAKKHNDDLRRLINYFENGP